MVKINDKWFEISKSDDEWMPGSESDGESSAGFTSGPDKELDGSPAGSAAPSITNTSSHSSCQINNAKCGEPCGEPTEVSSLKCI